MIKYLSANYIFPVSAEPIKDGVVSINDQGEIIKLFDRDSAESITDPIEKHEGIIVPGFVNSHCHLELSHMHQKLPKGQGVIPFVEAVIKQRQADDAVILAEMQKADKSMFDNGIVAVGDISNNIASKKVKQESKLYYHTYVEVMGFNPEKAEEVFDKGLELKEEFYPLSASITPHSAYSVSKELFKSFRNYSEGNENLFSLHNQETEEENKLYRYKTGGFLEFYKSLGLDVEYFKPQARNSVQSIIPLLPKDQKILLVHNIYTSLKDIYFVRRFGRDVTWCFCPNANLYIESKLPKLDMFLPHDFNITIGTDSLASNDKLCVLSELMTLNKYFPSLPLITTIKWATLNGAKFLGIDGNFGSIERGKKPGLNLITETQGVKLSDKSKVKRLV
ncbi:amidohydrolase family protein [Flavihumibacter sp. R14]|nr:amidohydrolase family protein [Flavihumibacter soli]